MLNERKHGGITCLATNDLTGDGLPDILVGRDDGVVEVYGLDDSDEPRLKFTHVRYLFITVLSDSEEIVDCAVASKVAYSDTIGPYKTERE